MVTDFIASIWKCESVDIPMEALDNILSENDGFGGMSLHLVYVVVKNIDNVEKMLS